MENIVKKTVITLGQQIKHKTFGVGKITGVMKERQLMITVCFEDGRKKDFLYPHPAIELLGEGKEPLVSAQAFNKGIEVKKPAEGIYKEIERVKKPGWMNYHPAGDLDWEQKLVVGKCYGTNAQKIFLKCCEVFGWDESAKGGFAMMKPLFAKGAAHGKSPWFLLHHSFVEPLERKFVSNWWNNIAEDVVYEEWREATDVFYHDFTDRVTFAKARFGYVYIGVFRSSPEDLFFELDPVTGKMMHVKRYHLVQTDYFE